MMLDIGRLHFDFSNPWLIVLGVSLLVSLLLGSRAIYRRLAHRSRLRATAVLALNALAYAIVLLFLLEPKISNPGGRPVILVTEGADLEKSPLPGANNVYVAPGFTASPVERRDLSSAGWLLDIGQLKYREPIIRHLEVRGYGLDQEQWEAIATHPEIGFETPVIGGFHSMRWQRHLLQGDILRIRGAYGQTGDNGVIELRLLDPAGNTAAEGRFKYGQPFSLGSRIKTRGILEYRLQAWDAGELRAEQVLPLEAGTGNGLDIMIVQSAPSYETRQLKDYAAAAGHRVRMSSGISKGKYIWQSANLPADADTTLSPALLAGQDVLIMDGRAFTELPPAHKQWLADAVGHGLGLLLLADASLLEAFGNTGPALLEGFDLEPLSAAEPTLIPRSLAGGERDWQAPVAVAAMRLSGQNADVLIAGDDGRNLVVRRPSGLGSVGISLIRHSHGWLTAGQRVQWSDYWSLLLSASARQRSDSFLLPAADADFYRVGQRAALCAMTRNVEADIEVAEVASKGQRTALKLPPAADTLQSSRRCAFFWPRTKGWHEVALLSDNGGTVLDQKSVYVFATDQWLDQQRAQRVNATTAWAAGAGTSRPGATENTVTEPMGTFWPWLALVLAASLLWMERRLDSA